MEFPLRLGIVGARNDPDNLAPYYIKSFARIKIPTRATIDLDVISSGLDFIYLYVCMPRYICICVKKYNKSFVSLILNSICNIS